MREPEYYLFVVDTNKYAGNFERELCAYVTGQVGESERGRNLAMLAREEIPAHMLERVEDNIALRQTDNNAHEYAHIFPSNKYVSDGNDNDVLRTEENAETHPYPAYMSVAIYFDDLPDKEIRDLLAHRARKAFDERYITQDGEQIALEGFRSGLKSE